MTRKRGLGLGIGLLGALSCALAFRGAAAMYHQFPQPAYGIVDVPPEELTFDVWYLAYGAAFVALAFVALGGGALEGRFVAWGRALRRSPRVPVLLALLAAALALAVRYGVLDRQVVSDDEEVYRFIARTLLEGRVVNPLPQDWTFFQNQFVVMNAHGWFGKYPIGHPLVLAAAMRVGLVDVVVPALGGATTWLTWDVGRRLLGPRRALLGAGLLVLSPHFVWTHATLLAQPTTCLGLLAGAACLLRARRSAHAVPWALGGGAALTLSVLARPAPGALFVGLGLFALGAWARRTDRPVVKALLPVAAPAAVGAAIFALVHYAQSGSPLVSGYQEAHGSLGFGVGGLAVMGQSVFAALVRENFWLFGWPLSLLPVLFARPTRGCLWLWGPVAVEFAYRVAVPKTVVSTTGPTYLMEAVPALALLAADGLSRLALIARRLGAAEWKGAVGRGWVASTAAALVFFAPVELRAMRDAARIRQPLEWLLAAQGLDRALVFTTVIVPIKANLTWAYYAPNPSPRLDDPILFVRWPKGDDAAAQAKAFWKRRFPDRPAFLFRPEPLPELVPLDSL